MSELFAVINPASCSRCDQNKVPAARRTICLRLTDQEIMPFCGYCGCSIRGVGAAANRAAFTIVRSLVQNGLFRVDGAGEPLRMPSFASTGHVMLSRFDESDEVVVTCRVNYGISIGHITPSKKEQLYRRYDRSLVHCGLPSCVRQAAEILSAITLGEGYRDAGKISFEMAAVMSDRKILRFLALMRNDKLTGDSDVYCYDHATVEFCWETTGAGSTLIPTPEELGDRPTKHSRLASEELQIRADVAMLRVFCAAALASKELVPLYRPVAAGAAEGSSSAPYHEAAINQVIGELEGRGWLAEVSRKDGYVLKLRPRPAQSA